MSESAIPISGADSENDWFACVEWDSCGYIGVRPNGHNESCPDCESGLESYRGALWKCAECETEYVGEGDAKDCCQ